MDKSHKDGAQKEARRLQVVVSTERVQVRLLEAKLRVEQS